MKSIFKILSLFMFLLSPMVVIANDCATYTSDGQERCEFFNTCKWEDGTCTEICTTDSSTNLCEDYNGCYDRTDAFGGCAPCEPGYYNNNTTNTTECQQCSSSFSTGQTFDTAYNNTYGLSTCPWMCDEGYYKSGDSCLSCPTNATSPAGSTSINDCQCSTGYYRGGEGMDGCIQCTGQLSCSGTGLEYSNPAPNGISCQGNSQLVPDDTHNTYSCQFCSDANATYDNETGKCKCNTGYYGTLNGFNTTCTACPAGMTSDPGSTYKSACHMTSATNFCDAEGQNCMNLIPNGVVISANAN